jgi:deoxyadenosine/deoxycytidine kinase
MVDAARTEPFIVAISGIIGAGKTELINALHAEYCGTKVAAEPCEDGPEESRNWLLSKFYSSPDKYAFMMQILLLHKRIATQKAAELRGPHRPGDIVLTDRCFLEDTIFADVLHEDGFISPTEMKVYMETVASMESYVRLPDLIIYLDVDPAVALARIKKRGRACEANMELSYLTKLRASYQRWLFSIQSRVPVVPLAWNDDGLDRDKVVGVCIRIVGALQLKLGTRQTPGVVGYPKPPS